MLAVPATAAALLGGVPRRWRGAALATAGSARAGGVAATPTAALPRDATSR